MGSYPVVLAGYRPLCMSVACCYYIHCRKYISLTAKNIFHCRKHISLPKIYRYFTAKQQKEKKNLSSIVMQTTVAYEMSQHDRM